MRGIDRTMRTQSARVDLRDKRVDRSYDFTFGRPSNQRVDRDVVYERYEADFKKDKSFDEMQKKMEKYGVNDIHRCEWMWGTCNECQKIEEEEYRKFEDRLKQKNDQYKS